MQQSPQKIKTPATPLKKKFMNGEDETKEPEETDFESTPYRSRTDSIIGDCDGEGAADDDDSDAVASGDDFEGDGEFNNGQPYPADMPPRQTHIKIKKKKRPKLKKP